MSTTDAVLLDWPITTHKPPGEHSLGGGLASAATVVTGTKGYTFNAAGLHANTVKRILWGMGCRGWPCRNKGT